MAAGASEVKTAEEVGASAATAEGTDNKTTEEVGGQDKPKGAPAAPAVAGAAEDKTTEEVCPSAATAEDKTRRAAMAQPGTPNMPPLLGSPQPYTPVGERSAAEVAVPALADRNHYGVAYGPLCPRATCDPAYVLLCLA